jgi:hypothetical protein
VAGNLGAGEVQRAAAAVETLLRNGCTADETRPELEQLAGVLDPFVAQLRSLEVHNPAADPAPTVAATQTRAVAARLMELFANFDTSAVAFAEEHQASLRPAFDAVAWERFMRKTQEFAFADAQSLLNEALALLAET